MEEDNIPSDDLPCLRVWTELILGYSLRESDFSKMEGKQVCELHVLICPLE